MAPRGERIAVEAAPLEGRVGFLRLGPHEKAYRVQPAAIRELSHAAAIDVVEAAAGEREAVCRQVAHRWGEIELAREPRLHGVLVRRFDVHEAARRHEGAYVRGEDLVR